MSDPAMSPEDSARAQRTAIWSVSAPGQPATDRTFQRPWTPCPTYAASASGAPALACPQAEAGVREAADEEIPHRVDRAGDVAAHDRVAVAVDPPVEDRSAGERERGEPVRDDDARLRPDAAGEAGRTSARRGPERRRRDDCGGGDQGDDQDRSTQCHLLQRHLLERHVAALHEHLA
jgi:hypothetical protein